MSSIRTRNLAFSVTAPCLWNELSLRSGWLPSWWHSRKGSYPRSQASVDGSCWILDVGVICIGLSSTFTICFFFSSQRKYIGALSVKNKRGDAIQQNWRSDKIWFHHASWPDLVWLFKEQKTVIKHSEKLWQIFFKLSRLTLKANTSVEHSNQYRISENIVMYSIARSKITVCQWHIVCEDILQGSLWFILNIAETECSCIIWRSIPFLTVFCVNLNQIFSLYKISITEQNILNWSVLQSTQCTYLLDYFQMITFLVLPWDSSV